MNAKKEPTTRLYIVHDADNNPVALVRAISVAAASRYIAQKKFTVSYAEQEDMFRAVKAGLEEESAIAVGGEE